MAEEIKTHSLGRLEIFIEPVHKVRHGQRSFFRRMFPRTAYLHIIEEARKEGIFKASAFSTQTSYNAESGLGMLSAEGSGARVAMCIQLVDSREKLEEFFRKHRELLQSKVVIYKEVEFWDA